MCPPGNFISLLLDETGKKEYNGGNDLRGLPPDPSFSADEPVFEVYYEGDQTHYATFYEG